jgi:hypothetical protein
MSYDSRYKPTYDEELEIENIFNMVFNALVVLTDYDGFCQKGMEVYYGDDYELKMTDLMYEKIHAATGLPVWKVRDIALDLCESQYVQGSWQSKVNGQWKEFAYD